MENLIIIARTFLDNAWKFFVQVEVPGLDVSVGALSIAFLFIGFSIRIFSYLTGFHAGAGSYGAAADAAEKVKAMSKSSHRLKK